MLGILGLVVLILLTVFLVPIRYRLKLRFHESVRAKVSVSWLLKIVRAGFYWLKNNGLLVVRLLFFKLMSKRFGKQPAPPEKGAAPESPAQSAVPADLPAEKSGGEPAEELSELPRIVPASEAFPDEKLTKKEKKSVKKKGEEAEDIFTPVIGPAPSGEYLPGEEFAEAAADAEKLREQRLSQKDTADPASSEAADAEEESPSWDETLEAKLEELQAKLQPILEKIDWGRAFLEDERNQRTFRKVLKKLGRMLRQPFPRSFKLEGELGMEDPAQTGKIIGYIYMLYPIYGDRVRVDGIYDHKEINLYLELGGRIRLGVFVESVLGIVFSILWNRNMRKMIFSFLKKKRAEKKAAKKDAKQAANTAAAA